MSNPKLEKVEPWAPHPKAAPKTKKDNKGNLLISANGTRTCCGGWQLQYSGIANAKALHVRIPVRFQGIERLRHTLVAQLFWGRPQAHEHQNPSAHIVDFLLPIPKRGNAAEFARTVKVPQGARSFTLRLTFRWSSKGKTVWALPRIERAAWKKRKPVGVCVVTGHLFARNGKSFQGIRDNINFYGKLCEAACKKHRPQLIALPEVALQWGIPGSGLDIAEPVPGPGSLAFAHIAKRNKVRIVLGMSEREGDAVFNSAVLISPKGKIDGKYRKVHLATTEGFSGKLPGDGFPVCRTEIGGIGCNICMDSSAAESSRMVGLNGADFLVLPIMGDHRASRWNPGNPIFNESRWKAIMRTRAMDNQLCMVVARNRVQGSCIVNRRGDILAWNEGDQDFIHASVAMDDGFRKWNGHCFRDINWLQRRPHIYQPFVDQTNVGSLQTKQ